MKVIDNLKRYWEHDFFSGRYLEKKEAEVQQWKSV
jgi:hypothetical protein